MNKYRRIKELAGAGTRFLVAIALVALLANGCFGGGPSGIKVTRVHKKVLEQTITVAGSLIATDPVDVSPSVSGIVDQMHAVEGAEVAAGEPIMKLSTDELERSLLSAKASKESAQNIMSLSNSLSSTTQSTFQAMAGMQASIDQAVEGVNIIAQLALPFLPEEQQAELLEDLEEYNRQQEENRQQYQVSAPAAASTSSSSQMAAANKSINNAQQNLDNSTIYAPAAGTLIPYTGGGLSIEALMASAMGSLGGMVPSGIDLTQISGIPSSLRRARLRGRG